MPQHVDTFGDHHLSNPIEDGIILMRDEQGVHTNVPHLVVHHSPDGFEFGYGGSGPADLALNICELLLTRTGYDGERIDCFDGDCFRLSWLMHQDFKWQFIAGADPDGETIPLQPAEQWIQAYIATNEAAS